MPAAGTYRHRVDFEEDVGVANSTSGQQEEDWRPVASGVWCHVEPLSGRDLVAAQHEMSLVTHRIRTRYLPDLLYHPRLRAKIGSRVLQIGPVLNIGERNVEIEMLCTEVI